MPRTCDPAATTSAHTRRLLTCAVAGIRSPPRVVRSPSVVGSCTSWRSASIRLGCFASPLLTQQTLGEVSGSRGLAVEVDGAGLREIDRSGDEREPGTHHVSGV